MIGKAVFGESSHIEFKRELPKRHENFFKDIIAFANTSGGKIILGVQDNGTVTGIGDTSPFRLADAISKMISDACIPQINTEITIRTVEAKTVLEVEVFPGKFRPYFLASAGKKVSCYIRINGTSRPADERKIQELEMEGKKLSYDTIPLVGVPYDEQLAKELCEQMYQTAISACRTDEECHAIKPMTLQKLEMFSILHRNGHKLMPTHAFELLTKPTDTFVKIQCAIFKGNDRAVFIDRKEFVGAIQKQVEEAYQFVLAHIRLETEIHGLYRRDTYELPSQSIREVIANAVLHRSYLAPSCIQVSIYDNRVEVDSPGMLYDGLTIEDAVKGKSKCRNAAIAVAFQYMKIVEAWGTGLPRLFQQCKELGLPEPRLEEFGDGIKVTIFRRQATKNKRQKTSDKDKWACAEDSDVSAFARGVENKRDRRTSWIGYGQDKGAFERHGRCVADGFKPRSALSVGMTRLESGERKLDLRCAGFARRGKGRRRHEKKSDSCRLSGAGAFFIRRGSGNGAGIHLARRKDARRAAPPDRRDNRRSEDEGIPTRQFPPSLSGLVRPSCGGRAYRCLHDPDLRRRIQQLL